MVGKLVFIFLTLKKYTSHANVSHFVPGSDLGMRLRSTQEEGWSCVNVKLFKKTKRTRTQRMRAQLKGNKLR